MTRSWASAMSADTDIRQFRKKIQIITPTRTRKTTSAWMAFTVIWDPHEGPMSW